jgi:hypothetical protein
MQFRLEIQAVESVCNFRLSWGIGGEQIIATVPYPTTIMLAYEHWREQYLAFYSSLPINESPSATISDDHPLRGKADISGTLEPTPVDWLLSLKHSQETLRSDFQEWLGRGELVHIRKKLFQAFAPIQSNPSAENAPILVLISCYSLELDRLPWEDWESEFGANQQIRFVRSPLDILQPTPAKVYRPRLRMLAIFGDETGQDFAAEKAALKSLAPQIKVELLNLQDDSSIDLKQQICTAIEDPIGWDMLFFAGHSSESAVTGGIIEIAPNQWMLITELLPSLQIAKEQGLHFAIFNSCRGLHIAQSLVSVGLSQIVIMREQIHGQVASKFLVKMTQKLHQGQDSHTAFLSACDYLKRISQNYPSAFLVPSLFAHPNATSISLRGWRWRSWFKQTLPKRREAIVLGSCIALSLFPQVRELLLDQRMWVQAQYRHWTNQVPQSSTPPVILVQIDKKTIEAINRDKLIPDVPEMNSEGNATIITDRRVIAKVIDGLTVSGAKVIGIDYLFNSTSKNSEADKALAKSVKLGSQQHGTWFIFANSYLKTERFQGVDPKTKIADHSTALYGCTNVDSLWHLKLPGYLECKHNESAQNKVPYILVPFPYMLSLASLLQQSSSKPQPQSDVVFQNLVLESASQNNQPKKIQILDKMQESDLTFISRYFSQYWLQPHIDYSIPPKSTFQTISAIDVILGKSQPFKPEQVVIIAAGVYDGAGFDSQNRDIVGKLPMATAYWQAKGFSASEFAELTGGELLASATHHFYHHSFLIPIPDLWMILLSGLASRGMYVISQRHSKRHNDKLIWFAIPIGYISFSILTYVTAGILMPILLPTVIWVWYSLPYIRRHKNA